MLQHDSKQQPNGIEWPEPQAIEPKLPPVEPFSADLLPESLRPWVLDTADRMQVPLDLVAAPLVVTIGGAIGRRACIQPKAKDTGWTETPNLFGASVAAPGSLKSPIIREVTRFVEISEEQAFEAYLKAMREYLALEDKEKAKAKKPQLSRLIVNNATFEKLHEIHSENPFGLLIICDELIGLFASMERNGHEGERQFYLTGWNGYSSLALDRIQRGTVRVRAMCLSLFGAIQPHRLYDYLGVKGDQLLSNDGMMQRIQVLVWPDPQPWAYVDRPPDLAATKRVQNIFDRILALKPDEPIRFVFSPDAQQYFVWWIEELESRLRSDALSPAMAAHISKYRKLMPSLALIFQIAEIAGGSVGFVGRRAGAPRTVSAENTILAIYWCNYLESHAHRVYSRVSKEIATTKHLADKLKVLGVGGETIITCREICQKGWTGLTKAEDVESALTILTNCGWVRPIESQIGPEGGRPAKRYEVNPRTFRPRSFDRKD